MNKNQLVGMRQLAEYGGDKDKTILFDLALEGDADAITLSRVHFTQHSDAMLTILRDARALLVRGWTQYTAARDADGLIIFSDHPTATCWCLSAAIAVACAKGGTYPYAREQHLDLLLTFSAEIGRVDILWSIIETWNDTEGRTQADVIDLVDLLIARFTVAG